MSIIQRIRPIREAEELRQVDFCEITGLSYESLKKYELGKNKQIGSDQIEKITTHERFKKYAFWLTTGEILPLSGQINPDIEIERRKQNLPDTPDGYRVAYESINAGSDEKTA